MMDTLTNVRIALKNIRNLKKVRSQLKDIKNSEKGKLCTKKYLESHPSNYSKEYYEINREKIHSKCKKI